MAQNFTVLYAASSAPLSDTGLFAEAYEKVSERRKARVDRFCFDKDKKLSLTAELLLRYGLSKCGIAFNEKELSYNEKEKPYFSDGRVFFNLSHSGEYAVCAVSDCEVGCDIEMSDRHHGDIAGHFFCKEEAEYIASLPSDEEQAVAFTRFWTLKESFVKAVGLGLNLPFDSFRMILGNEVSLIQNYDCRSYKFTEFDCFKGYRCAVCSVGNDSPVILKNVDFSELLK